MKQQQSIFDWLAKEPTMWKLQTSHYSVWKEGIGRSLNHQIFYIMLSYAKSLVFQRY